MEIFTPTILLKSNAKDEMVNGDLAFCPENHRIYLKSNNEVHNYGGLFETEVTDIIANIINQKEMHLSWEVLEEE